MIPSHEINKTTTFDGRIRAGVEVLELPVVILQDDTGQVIGYERT